MKKFFVFLMKLFLIIVISGIILISLYFINKTYNLWDISVDLIQSQIQDLNKILFVQIAAGISVGTILILLFIFLFPFLTKNVNTKEYIKNIILGVIASFVFYISHSIYQYFEKFGKIYKIIAIAVVVVITIVTVEIMSAVFRSHEKKVEFRTAVLGCIASGLIFGIVLNIVLLALEYLK